MTSLSGSVGGAGALADAADEQSRWEALRPIITDLYINRDMSLAAVRESLRECHDFDASKSMFKRKLHQWNLSKNLSSREMEKLLQALKINNEQELRQISSNGEICFEGHKVRLSNVKRYLRRRQSSRTRDASDDELPMQISDDKGKATYSSICFDTPSNASLRGSPAASALGVEDISSMWSDLASETPSINNFSSLSQFGLFSNSPSTGDSLSQSLQLPPTSPRRTTVVLDDVDDATLKKISDFLRQSRVKVRRIETVPVHVSPDPETMDLTGFDFDATSTLVGGVDNSKDTEAIDRGSNVPLAGVRLQKQLFACPFFKYDPSRYSEKNPLEVKYRRCATVMLQNLPRLKQHLYRVHARPDHYCSRCFEVFSNAAELDSHLAAGMVCHPRPEDPFRERASPAQMSAIKRRAINRGPEDTWFAIYDILFPGAKKPPSPYIATASPGHLQDFSTFFEQTGRYMMLEIFKRRLDTVPLDYHAKKFVKKTFQDAASELLSILASDSSFEMTSFDAKRQLDSDLLDSHFYPSLPEPCWLDRSVAPSPASFTIPSLSAPSSKFDSLDSHFTLGSADDSLLYDDSRFPLTDWDDHYLTWLPGI